MRERALIHIAGPNGAGKTTLIERLLDAETALSICVRAERDRQLRKERESAPQTHAELRRYRTSGASAVARYRFADPNADAFFAAEVMQGFSTAVFIEGDCPVEECVDLAVFVAPVQSAARPLLRRVIRDHTASRQALIEQLRQAIEDPQALVRFLGVGLGESFVEMVSRQPKITDDLRRSVQSKLDEVRLAPPPAPTECWAIEDHYIGVERAQLVVVNVRTEAEMPAAEALVEQIGRLRKDDEVYRDVIGLRGNKLPVMAVIANLSNRKDAGLKKAITRVKRATNTRGPRL